MRIKGLNKKEIKKALLSLPIVWGMETRVDTGKFLEKTVKINKEKIYFKIEKEGHKLIDSITEKPTDEFVIYILRISGAEETKMKNKLIRWFIDLFGNSPFSRNIVKDELFVAWDAEKVDKKLNPISKEKAKEIMEGLKKS